MGRDNIHPCACLAKEYLDSLPRVKLEVWLNVLSSSAIEGGSLSRRLADTLRKHLNGDPIGDMDILGLAYFLLDSAHRRCGHE